MSLMSYLESDRKDAERLENVLRPAANKIVDVLREHELTISESNYVINIVQGDLNETASSIKV